MKKELIEFLKTKHIPDIGAAFHEAKYYYRSKDIPMGGSYASFSTTARISLNIGGQLQSFKIDLSELI